MSAVANPPLRLGRKQQRDFRNLIDGLLLGDGHISKVGTFTLNQSVKRQGWQFSVRRRFRSFGLKTTVRAAEVRAATVYDGKVIQGGPSRFMYSEIRPELKDQRRRWYPNGKKVVPEDIELTPECIAHWMAGDGSGNKIGQIIFSTQGFSRADCELLVSRMPVRAVLARSAKRGQYAIKVHARDDAYKLAEIILPYMPKCTLYKLQYVARAKIRTEWNRKLTDDQVALARRLYSNTVAWEIAESLKVSVPTIMRAVRGRHGERSESSRLTPEQRSERTRRGRLRTHPIRPFTEARAFVRTLGLRSRDEYRVWCKSGMRPRDIPETPERVYRAEFLGVGDWLGTGRIANQRRQFRPFVDARCFVRAQHLSNAEAWRSWAKTKRPSDIPSTPAVVYADKGWLSMPDWLGVE